MLPALPEKNMVFKGLVTNKEDMNKLMLTPRIHYPLPGGSGLITFEKEEGKSEKSTAAAMCPGRSGPSLRSPLGQGLELCPLRCCAGLRPVPKALAALCPVPRCAQSRQLIPCAGHSPCLQWPRLS